MFEAIASVLKSIANAFGFAYLSAIFIGAILVALLVAIVITRLSYETKLLKTIDGFNAYLRTKPYVADDNLIEFNNRMKAAPGVLRNRWQMFVLNREDGVQKYINLDSCVEKPLRTSTIDRVIKNFTAVAVFLVFLSAVFGAALISDPALSLAEMLFRILAIPAVIVLVAVVGVIVVRALKGAVQSDLYEYFHIFEQNVARAVTTLPPYIDYEILFTRKEIRDSIPVLQQYLEKRAITEQEELEKARKNAIEVESYNFDELGLNGALLLERAMRECEVYLGTKRRLRVECDNIETERANYAKNYERTSKEYQTKLAISRENLESLKKQQESSTNRIESNFLKKQQADEIKKQQQIEKDADLAALKFKEEQEALKAEITKRQEEVEVHRARIEDAMKHEFKNYARLMFVKLQEISAEKLGTDYTKLVEDNEKLKSLIKRAKGGSAELEKVAEELEEEDREKEALGEKKIPKFVLNTFDITAETNFDNVDSAVVKEKPAEEVKSQTPAEEIADTQQGKPRFEHDEFKPSIKIEEQIDESFRPSIKTDSGDDTDGGMKPEIKFEAVSEGFRPSIRTDAGERLTEDDFKKPVFEPEKDFTADFKFGDDSDVDAGRKVDAVADEKPTAPKEDFSVLYNQIYDQIKNESGETEAPKAEEPKKLDEDDTLLSVSQKLEEENRRLKEQKAALESEVNETIKRIEEPAPKPKTKPKNEPIDDVQFMLNSMKESLKKQQPAEPVKKVAPAPVASAAKPVRPVTVATKSIRPVTSAPAAKPAPAARTAARPLARTVATSSARPAASPAVRSSDKPLPRQTAARSTAVSATRSARPAASGAAKPVARRRPTKTDDGHNVDDIAGEIDKLISSNKKK